MTPIKESAMPGGGRNRASPCVSTSTSRSIRSLCSIANRAARAPPGPFPTSTGGIAQVCPMSSSSHVRTASASGGPSDTSDAPRPGRSGAMTRWVVTSSGITRIHTAANSPCRKTIGGPSPPSSTAVDTPASCTRRSVTGRPARSRSRASSPAVRRPRSFTSCCVLMVASPVALRCNVFDRDATEWPAAPLRAKHPNRAATRRG